MARKPKIEPAVEYKYVIPGCDTAEALNYIDNGPLPDDFKDWPAHMQDAQYKAVEQLRLRTGKPYELLKAACGFDGERYYTRAVAVAKRSDKVQVTEIRKH